MSCALNSRGLISLEDLFIDVSGRGKYGKKDVAGRHTARDMSCDLRGSTRKIQRKIRGVQRKINK